jgi:hypothetical protein
MYVKFLTPVSHDGVDYAVGESADLSPDAAKALVASGFAESKGRASKQVVDDAVIVLDETAPAQ